MTRSSLSFLLLAASALAGVVGCGGSQRNSRSPKDEARQRLIGAWRLAALEEREADGAIRRADCTGLLIFTSDGKVSVQVMYRDAAAHGGSAYAQGGYEASFGTYEVDDAGKVFTIHVEGALVRTLIAQALPRAFEVSDGRLLVTSSNPDERWRVVWER